MSSNTFNDKERERARQLMMAALDDEISGEEQAELDRYLARDDNLRREWHSMGQVKEVTSSMAFREPPEEVWETYWTSVYNKIERGIGWIFVSIGAVVVLAWAARIWIETLFEDNGMPLFVKLAILSVTVGFLVLAVSVIREKLFTRIRDPYKEIQR